MLWYCGVYTAELQMCETWDWEPTSTRKVDRGGVLRRTNVFMFWAHWFVL